MSDIPIPYATAAEAAVVKLHAGDCHLVQVAGALTGGKEGFLLADHRARDLFWDSAGCCFGVRVHCTATPDEESNFGGTFKLVLEEQK
jgi:hypothetical protein